MKSAFWIAGVLWTGLFCSAAEPLVLVMKGKSDFSIVVRVGASASERRGAGELQFFIEKISGAKLPIIEDDKPLPAKSINVGFTRHTREMMRDLDPAKVGSEGFYLVSEGHHVFVAGSPVRGAMYGCYELLDDLGVRFYTPTVTRWLARPTLRVGALRSRTQPVQPLFEYREVYCTEAFEKEWAARLRLNGHSHRLDESTGGKVRYSHFVHTFDDLIPRAMFATHPEYFPVIKGKRTDGYVQRCLSNADVLRITIETVGKWIEKEPGAMIYSVSQNDCYKWCECDECTKIARQFGGQSGLYLWFVNQVAESIEKKHPDKLIDTLAYQFTEAPPTGIVPRKNVRVRLCPIANCYAHPFEQCKFPATAKFMEALRSWARITDTLYIWHYNTNFAHYLMPFPNFDEFAQSVDLYRSSGVKGIFFEGCYGPGGGGSFAELQAYVMAQKMWNVNAVPNVLVAEWHQGVYGPAAPPMLQWFDLLHERVRPADKHFGIYHPPSVYYLADDVIAKGDELFNEAEKLAAQDAVAKLNIAKSKLGLRYVKLMRKPNVAAEFETFVADVKDFKIGQISEGKTVEQWEKEYRAKHGKK